MRKLILEGGSTAAAIQARGLFSFVIQFVSVHRAYFLREENYKIQFDLRESAYSANSNNHWDSFFVQEPIGSGERTVWGEGGNTYGYSFDFYDINEREIAKDIIQKHLILQPQIQEIIQDFYDNNFKGSKILGVHKRGTDISIHHEPASLESFFNVIDGIVQNYDKIFLSTDEKKVVEEFKRRYPNVLNVSYHTLSDYSHIPNFKAPDSKSRGYQIGVDAILDSYLLSMCDFLIKGNSNLSNFSLLLNPELKFLCL